MRFSFGFISITQLKNVREFSKTITQGDPLEKFKMKSWQIHDYGEDPILTSTRIPIVDDINDILVKVEAVSVNPIDVYMKDGYARSFLNVFRNGQNELPLTLGRDFSGTIVQKGFMTNPKYQVDDKVYGFVTPHKQGSFAEYLLVDHRHILHQPKMLTPDESSSIVYTAMTAWGALFITGGLQFGNCKNKRVLILGASGGVGTAAIQLLKSQGIHVTGTCSTDAVPLIRSLGADDVLDYTDSNYLKQIEDSSFDIILDCAKFGTNVPRNWKFGQFISLNSPLMLDTDKYGVIIGLLRSGQKLLTDNVTHLGNGRMIKWGFFIPCQKGFEFINELITSGELRPIIHKKFDFAQLPEALGEVKRGHLRGKVVATFN